MKRIIACILSVLVISSVFTACAQKRTLPEEWRPDIEYWEKAVAENSVETRFQMGVMGEEDIDPAEWVEVLKNIEMYPNSPVHTNYEAVTFSQSIVSMHNKSDDSWLNIGFFNNFNYAAVWTVNVGDIKYYRLGENPQLVDFMESTVLYIDGRQRVSAINTAEKAVITMDFRDIASLAGRDPYSLDVKELPQNLTLVDFADVHAYGTESGNGVSLFARYIDTEGKEYNYYIMFYIDPQTGEISRTFTGKRTNTNMLYAPYFPRAEIGGVDYSMWLDKLDYPYYNRFYYEIGGTNGGNCSSDAEFCTDIMYTLHHLKIGEKADIDMKGYDKKRHNIIRLFEESDNYDLGNYLRLVFVQDCEYVAVCPHGQEYGVCYKGDTVYKVKNPQSVRDLFEKHGTYISQADFDSLQEYAHHFISTTKPEKLMEMSQNEIVLPENMVIAEQFIHFSVNEADSIDDRENTDDYTVNFRCFFHDTDSDTFGTYSVMMLVDKTSNGWETERFAIEKW